MLHAPALEGTDLRHVRATISAGAPLPPTVAREWEERTGSPTCSFYGAMDLGQLAVPSPDDPAEKRWSTVGRPHDRAEVMICDPDGNAVERGEEGEICMRGPLVQPRYWGEDETPYSDDGWAHFGDLGLHRRRRATCTSPAASRTRSSAAAATSTRSRSRTCCAAARRSRTSASSATPTRTSASGRARSWSATPGDEPTLEDLTAHLDQAGLARYKWPESLHLLDALPVGSTGKVDRQSLIERARGKEA